MSDIKLYVESNEGILPLDDLKSWHRCDDNDLWCDYEDVKPLIERIAELEDDVKHHNLKRIYTAARIRDLEKALARLAEKAEECDGWESFPSVYIDDAHKVLGDNND